MADGDEDLVIKVRIDNSDALAKQRAVDAGNDRIAAKADRAAKAMASANTKAAQAQVAGVNKAADVQVAAAARVQAAHQKAIGAQIHGHDQLAKKLGANIGLGDRFSASVAGIGLQAIAVRGVATAFDLITKALADSNKGIDDYAKNLLKTKDDLKELATLKGLATSSDAFIKQVSTFSRATGLSITQTDEFQRQFLGSAAGGAQKGNIDAATQEQLMLEGGKVAARQTKDLATRGDLLGILSQFKKYATGQAGVQAALADAEAVRIGLTEGRGDDAPLTKSLLHVAGSLAGEGKRVGSLSEMAALIGVTSLSAGPGQADTRSEQLVRGLQGETPDQVKFLKDFAGIDEHDTLEGRLDKLVPKLRAMKDAGRDVQGFLTENKINAEQVRAISEAEPNYELLKGRFAAARGSRGGAEIMAESARQAQLDPLQRSKMAEADLVAAGLGRGAERQDIVANITAAQAKLVEEGVDTSLIGKFRQFVAAAGTGGQASGMEALAQQRALADLAAKTGTAPPSAPGGGVLNAIGTGLGLANPGALLANLVNNQSGSFAAGVDMTSGTSQAKIKLLQRLVEIEQAELLRKNPAPSLTPGGANAGRVR